MRSGALTLPPLRLVLGHRVGAFRLFGFSGLGAAVILAVGLVAARSGSVGVELVLIAAAMATFLGLAALSRSLIYYHHEIAVLGQTAALAWALDAPVLLHLDATALGLGAFLAFGRIGCLHVGCCHGRPAARGAVYTSEHADLGFPRYLVGLRLVPVQAIEACGVLALVVAGSAAVAAGAAAGAGVALYVGGYALLRFPLELLRGDPGRRWWAGLSEAQWTSLALAAVILGLGVGGVLPGPAWLHALPLVVLACLAGLQVAGVIGRPHGALDPRHVRELAEVVRAAERRPADVIPTSFGLRVSFGADSGADHWSFSGPSPGTTRSLARAVLWLRRPEADAELVSGPEGLLHLVVPR